MCAALESAGVTFNRHWGGEGESAMEEAALLTARKLGWRAVGLING